MFRPNPSAQNAKSHERINQTATTYHEHMAAKQRPSSTYVTEPKGFGKRALDKLKEFWGRMFSTRSKPFNDPPKRSDNRGRAYHMKMQRSFNELREQRERPRVWTVREWLVYCARHFKRPSRRDTHRYMTRNPMGLPRGTENRAKAVRAIMGKMKMILRIETKLNRLDRKRAGLNQRGIREQRAA